MIHHHPYIGLRFRTRRGGTEGILVALAVEAGDDGSSTTYAYLLTDHNTHYNRALNEIIPCDPTEARRRLGVVEAPKVEPAAPSPLTVPAEHLAQLPVGWRWRAVTRVDTTETGYSAFAFAADALEAEGLNVGPSCDGMPAGAWDKAPPLCAWDELTDAQRLDARAVIVGDFARGPVWVLWREVDGE